MSTITVNDGTTITTKIGDPGSRLFSLMAGRSQRTTGTRRCCSSSTRVIAS